METLGIIGMVVGIIFIIAASFKGLSIVVSAPLAAIIVVLTNQMPFFESLLGVESSFMTELGGFIISTFVLFLLGSILAQYMDQSGASTSIANQVLEWIGLDNEYLALIALVIIGTILTYGGISVFVVIFALVPLARPIFKKLDLNWALVVIPIGIGAGSFTVHSAPGSPSMSNVIPAQAMGTGLSPAIGMSLVSIAATVIFGLLYMYQQLKKSRANNEGYYDYILDDEERKLAIEHDRQGEEIEAVEGPGFWLAIMPLAVLIAINLIFANVNNIIYVSLTVGILLCVVLYRKYLPGHMVILNQGAASSTGSVMNTASAVAFGSTMANSIGFSVVQRGINAMVSSPLMQGIIISAVLSGITGSSSGTLGILVETHIPAILEAGFDPGAVHRLLAIASCVLTAVPFSGVVVTLHNYAGIKMNAGYKHFGIVVMGGTFISLLAALGYYALVY